MHNKFLLILVLLIFIGCKESKSENTNDVKVKSEVNQTKKETFIVTLKGVFEKDDTFGLFYTENETEKFSADQLVTTKFSAQKGIQDIVLETPRGVYPLTFRLDFGSNREQSKIKIYECILNYEGNSYTIEGKNLKKYFTFNDGIKMESDSLTFSLKTFNFKGKDVYDPYIKGNKNLTEVLDFKL